MKLINYACPSCGAQLQIDSEKNSALCPYCGQIFGLKKEILESNTENIGYEFEKGRIRAQNENNNTGLFCPFCGCHNTISGNFCSKCGNKLNINAYSATNKVDSPNVQTINNNVSQKRYSQIKKSTSNSKSIVEGIFTAIALVALIACVPYFVSLLSYHKDDSNRVYSTQNEQKDIIEKTSNNTSTTGTTENNNDTSQSTETDLERVYNEAIEKFDTSPAENVIPTIPESEIYNENGISIVTKTLRINKTSDDYYVDFIIENSSDKDYRIAIHTWAVNGLMCGDSEFGFGAENVPSGKKTTLSAEITAEWMNKNNISDIKSIQALFWAYYDSFKEWNTPPIDIMTNHYSPDELYDPNGSIVLDDEVATVWYLGNEGNKLNFCVLNKTDYNADFSIDNCSVNEWSYDVTSYTYDLFTVPINSGAYSNFTLEPDKDFLEKNSINTVDSVEFNIEFEDNNWDMTGSKWKHTTAKIIQEK